MERGQEGQQDAESEEEGRGGGCHALGEGEEEGEEMLRGARMACGRLGVIVEVALRTEEVLSLLALLLRSSLLVALLALLVQKYKY